MADPNRSSVMDWTAEDEFWRDNYKQRPYAGSNDYNYWQPAYRYGYDSAQQYGPLRAQPSVRNQPARHG